MSKFVEIEEPKEVAGIRFHNKDYAVDPTVENLLTAQEIFKDKEKARDTKEIIAGVKLIIPEFPVEELHLSEIVPVLDGIKKALQFKSKKV